MHFRVPKTRFINGTAGRQPKAFGPKRHPVQLYALLTQILFGGSSTFRPNKGETLGFDDAKLDNQTDN